MVDDTIFEQDIVKVIKGLKIIGPHVSIVKLVFEDGAVKSEINY